MDRGIEHHVLDRAASPALQIAVKASEHHRLAQLAIIHHLLDRLMRRVIDPHESDLHQTPAQFGLGPDHPFGVRQAGRQGLLAEGRFAGPQTGDRQLRMGRIGRGDHHRVDRWVGDQGRRPVIGARAAAVFGDRSRQRQVQVHHGGELGAGDPRRQVARVPPTHAAGADDADGNPAGHVCCLQNILVCPRGRTPAPI